MADVFDNLPGDWSNVPGGGEPSPSDGAFSEKLQHSAAGARLPDAVAPGVFCTGVIVQEGPDEFVVDFVQGLAHPPRVGARVIVSLRMMSQLVRGVRENLERFEKTYGALGAMPRPAMDRRPSIAEIYDDLRISDDQHRGAYATGVMIRHTGAEFLLDFMTRFFPTPCVCARVYVAAAQVPRLLETLATSYHNSMRRRAAGGPDAAEPPPVPPDADMDAPDHRT